MVQHCFPNELEGNGKIWYFLGKSEPGGWNRFPSKFCFTGGGSYHQNRAGSTFRCRIVAVFEYQMEHRGEIKGASIKHLPKQSASNYGNERSRLWLLKDVYFRYVIQFQFLMEWTRLEKLTLKRTFGPFSWVIWWQMKNCCRNVKFSILFNFYPITLCCKNK